MAVYCLELDLGAPPASSDEFIHLDGPLSYAAGVEAVGHDGLDELGEGDGPEYFEETMPLARYEVGDEWVWACSAAAVAIDAAGDLRTEREWHATRWRTRFDHVPEHQRKDTQINVSSGPYKAYNAALPYVETTTLAFLFEPAPGVSWEPVIDLLDAHVPAIGKKRSQGYGTIRDKSLYDVSEVYDSAIYADGSVLRSVPTEFTARVPEQVYFERRTVRPPYWHQANQCLAYPPFAEVPRTDLADGVGLARPAAPTT